MMSELDDIEKTHQGITDVFQLWYEIKRCPYTWDTLLKIIRLPAVNEPELPDKLYRSEVVDKTKLILTALLGNTIITTMMLLNVVLLKHVTAD